MSRAEAEKIAYESFSKNQSIRMGVFFWLRPETQEKHRRDSFSASVALGIQIPLPAKAGGGFTECNLRSLAKLRVRFTKRKVPIKQ